MTGPADTAAGCLRSFAVVLEAAAPGGFGADLLAVLDECGQLAEQVEQAKRAAFRTGELAAECDILAARVAELEAILAEGDQRDRALALLLLRDGGRVEFTEAERVAAPQHGQLVSHPNLATGGLVLAYSADGVTIGTAALSPETIAMVQQGVAEAERGETTSLGSFAQYLDACECECVPGQPCGCTVHDCGCFDDEHPCPVCDAPDAEYVDQDAETTT